MVLVKANLSNVNVNEKWSMGKAQHHDMDGQICILKYSKKRQNFEKIGCLKESIQMDFCILHSLLANVVYWLAGYSKE